MGFKLGVAIKVNTILSKTFFLCEMDRPELVRKRKETLARTWQIFGLETQRKRRQIIDDWHLLSGVLAIYLFYVFSNQTGKLIL